jgi:uncharacterized membrane protein
VLGFTGVFCSSWLGGVFLNMGEWIIKKLPLVKHIYSAAKQVSAAVNPANESTASFQECVLIRHPRHGEYAFAFITGSTVMQVGASPDGPGIICGKDLGFRKGKVCSICGAEGKRARG